MDDQHGRLTEALSAMPEVWARLLADHRPDQHGRCQACGTPGTGTARREWPCTLARLARGARRIADGEL